MTDLILAIAHHLLVFGLIAMLVMERGLLGATPVDVRRLGGLDMGYGITAGLVIAVGVCRVVFGARGWAFYEANPFFWTKMASYAAMGLASVPPTVAILNWRKTARTDPAFQPPADAVARARKWTGVQLLLLVPILASAAAMARWGGF